MKSSSVVLRSCYSKVRSAPARGKGRKSFPKNCHSFEQQRSLFFSQKEDFLHKKKLKLTKWPRLTWLTAEVSHDRKGFKGSLGGLKPFLSHHQHWVRRRVRQKTAVRGWGEQATAAGGSLAEAQHGSCRTRQWLKLFQVIRLLHSAKKSQLKFRAWTEAYSIPMQNFNSSRLKLQVSIRISRSNHNPTSVHGSQAEQLKKDEPPQLNGSPEDRRE